MQARLRQQSSGYAGQFRCFFGEIVRHAERCEKYAVLHLLLRGKEELDKIGDSARRHVE